VRAVDAGLLAVVDVVEVLLLLPQPAAISAITTTGMRASVGRLM
jgi:hypothetical protein